MNLRGLLTIKSVHYFVTRFCGIKLRSVAFDEKYRNGDWTKLNDGSGELPAFVSKYLKGGDLLIMGCGGCSILEAISTGTLNTVVGVDLSDEAIQLASRYTQANVSFVKADMTKFTCRTKYDVILFSESLYYVPGNKQKALLTHLATNLKEDGVIIVTIADPDRYKNIVNRIRRNFCVLDHRLLKGSSRTVLSFRL